jgi:hypothetical protein
MYQSGYESSDLSDLEETCDDNTFDKICREKEGPRLSKEEISLLNTYTYDKEPVKAWRQNSDYRVLRECNEYRCMKSQNFWVNSVALNVVLFYTKIHQDYAT